MAADQGHDGGLITAGGPEAPRTVVLSTELRQVQRRWRAASNRAEQDQIYAQEFCRPFARLFATLPLHNQPDGLVERPKALISVLGLSWQPVALMASWLQPERMLVLGTRESLATCLEGRGVLSFVAEVAGVERDVIESREMPDPGEIEIYREIRAFVARHRLERGSGSPKVAVDPTGGKKSMSASTALAGFLEGALLVYVDYAEYDGPNRIPVAGTEYPRVLANPLEVLGDLEVERVCDAFRRGSYAEAERLARGLARRLYEPREAEALAALASAYGAWAGFRFADAARGLRHATDLVSRFARSGAWRWAQSLMPTLDTHSPILQELAVVPERPAHIRDGIPIALNHLAAARREHEQGGASRVVMLAYAAVERIVDLVLLVRYGLDDERPCYANVSGRYEMKNYEAAGRAMFGPTYRPREPEGPLTYIAGIQLLAALEPGLFSGQDLAQLKRLADIRNKCEFEHGFLPRPADAQQARGNLAVAERVVRHLAGNGDLEAALAKYRFPVL